MKSLVIRSLHTILGYENYLYIFSICKIPTLRFFRKKWDYLYFVDQFNTNDNIVVIGASTGITTIPLAKKCEKGKVFAYEPIQDNYGTILKLIKHYRVNNCEAYNLGLGDTPEQHASMLIPVIKGVKKQGMAHLDVDDIDKYKKYIEVTAQIDTLDNRKEIQEIHIDGMKLVAENYELEILRGAEKTIKKNKPLIYCELWDNKKRDEVIGLIESFGYQVFYRKKGKLKPVDIDSYRERNLILKPIDE
jgi:FkbM family methyltransferase